MRKGNPVCQYGGGVWEAGLKFGGFEVKRTYEVGLKLTDSCAACKSSSRHTPSCADCLIKASGPESAGAQEVNLRGLEND